MAESEGAYYAQHNPTTGLWETCGPTGRYHAGDCRDSTDSILLAARMNKAHRCALSTARAEAEGLLRDIDEYLGHEPAPDDGGSSEASRLRGLIKRFLSQPKEPRDGNE